MIVNSIEFTNYLTKSDKPLSPEQKAACLKYAERYEGLEIEAKSYATLMQFVVLIMPTGFYRRQAVRYIELIDKQRKMEPVYDDENHPYYTRLTHFIPHLHIIRE